MLDEKGITLAEVEHKYPRVFQALGYDVLMDTDSFNKPRVISTFEMCVNAILCLMKMKPGQYPSIPELGLDVEQYLHEYSDDKTIPATLKTKLYNQLNMLELTGIEIEIMFDKTDDGHDALLIQITGNDKLEYGEKLSPVIIGITYDELNRLYSKVSYAKDRS